MLSSPFSYIVASKEKRGRCNSSPSRRILTNSHFPYGNMAIAYSDFTDENEISELGNDKSPAPSGGLAKPGQHRTGGHNPGLCDSLDVTPRLKRLSARRGSGPHY